MEIELIDAAEVVPCNEGISGDVKCGVQETYASTGCSEGTVGCVADGHQQSETNRTNF